MTDPFWGEELIAKVAELETLAREPLANYEVDASHPQGNSRG
jgi:hypothetical protein